MIKEILIKRLSPDVNLPSFKSDGASGLDLEDIFKKRHYN